MKNLLLRCVIVDDDPDWIDLARRCLARSRLRFRITSFPSAAEALEFLKQNEADAVVTDYLMPEISGLDLVHALRADGNHLPVVMISSDEAVEPDAIRYGADAFIVKGQLAGRLCETVERCVHAKAASQEAAPDAAHAER